MSEKIADLNRRIFLRSCLQGAVLLVTHPLVGVLYAARLNPTPSNTAGPYYKEGAPFKTNLVEADDHGTPLSVTGKVLNTDRMLVSGAILDVWHTNPEGNYDLNGYKHRGKIAANSNGEYHFDSVVPGAYGGRAQHIHYIISAPGHRTLITQLYFENDPFFEGNVDQNLGKDPIVASRELVRPVLVNTKNQIRSQSVIFQICLEKA